MATGTLPWSKHTFEDVENPWFPVWFFPHLCQLEKDITPFSEPHRFVGRTSHSYPHCDRFMPAMFWVYEFLFETRADP